MMRYLRKKNRIICTQTFAIKSCLRYISGYSHVVIGEPSSDYLICTTTGYLLFDNVATGPLCIAVLQRVPLNFNFNKSKRNKSQTYSTSSSDIILSQFERSNVLLERCLKNFY